MRPDSWTLRPLTPKLRQQMHHDVNWIIISRNFELSEELIHRHQAQVHWPFISAYQHLSEEFIIQHRDKVHWQFISAYQDLTEGFIIQHLDLLDLTEIASRYPSTYRNHNLDV